MKAIVCTKYGPAEVLQPQEVEKPSKQFSHLVATLQRNGAIPSKQTEGFISGIFTV